MLQREFVIGNSTGWSTLANFKAFLLMVSSFLQTSGNTHIHRYTYTHTQACTHPPPPTPTHRAHSCQYKHVPTAHSDTYNIATGLEVVVVGAYCCCIRSRLALLLADLCTLCPGLHILNLDHCTLHLWCFPLYQVVQTFPCTGDG